MSPEAQKKRALLIIAISMMIVSVIGGKLYEVASRPTAAAGSDAPSKIAGGFQEALAAVQDNYAGDTNYEVVGKASIQGMLRQLDPHSAFFNQQEFEEMQIEQSSRIYGIGVTIQKRYDRVYILSVTPGAPGHRAGLRYGDGIVAINGQNASEWTTEQVMHKVRGERGAPVQITVERAGAPGLITVTAVRDEVRLPSVRNAFMINNTRTGYIALTGGFSSKTDEEVTDALAKLKKDGMRQLILDLRDNPGGLLNEAVKVTTKFLSPGQKIVEVRGRNGQPSSSPYLVPEKNEPETFPLVVLVNRNSASASEIVAGALQDHDRAIIVGEKTFGKGLVQQVIKLPFGTGLVLTTAKYLTPAGRSIQRDYTNVSFYDYYRNRNEDKQGVKGAPRGEAYSTDLGSPVYGGGGIEPTVVVKSPDSSSLRRRLFYGVFDFARQLVAGQIAGFDQYRIAETQNKSKLKDDDLGRYPVSDALAAAFRQYVTDKPHFNFTDEQFSANLDYIRSHLRREIITAAYGPEAGDQVYLTDDVQFRKAVESLDQARMLAENARRARSDNQ